MSNLPTLPKLNISQWFDWAYTDDQMREYGQQCREAALEEAVVVLMSMHEKCNGNHNYYKHAAIYMKEKLK